MTVTGYVREDLAVIRPGESPASTRGSTESSTGASRTSHDGLAGRIMRLTWLWPALLALALGLYQLGRPELWRDELASWSGAGWPEPGPA